MRKQCAETVCGTAGQRDGMRDGVRDSMRKQSLNQSLNQWDSGTPKRRNETKRNETNKMEWMCRAAGRLID